MVIEAAAATWHIERPTIVLATLFPAQVRRRRERLRHALVRPVRKEYLWAPSLALVHNARVFEPLDEGLLSPTRADVSMHSSTRRHGTHWIVA